MLGESTRTAQKRLEGTADDLASSNDQLVSKVADQSLISAIVESSDDAIISKTLDGIITSRVFTDPADAKAWLLTQLAVA